MNVCPECNDEYSSLTTHLNDSFPEHLPNDWPTCHDCGKWYKKLGTHWSQSTCSYPEVSKRCLDILTGVVMGDGWVDRDKNHCRVCVSVTRKEYLDFLDKELGVLSCGVSLSKTSKESANLSGGSESHHKDIYRLTSICHPQFDKFGKWYSSGKKVWPKNIKLTPETLKNWYCCDGHYKNSSNDNYITISMSSEKKNRKKVKKYFSQSNIPEPKFNIGKNTINGKEIDKCIARWTVDESKELWEYMGEPLPGFEYKWPEDT